MKTIIVFVLYLLITSITYADTTWIVYNGTTETQTLTLCAMGFLRITPDTVTQEISPGQQQAYTFSESDLTLCGPNSPNSGCGNCYTVSNASNTPLVSSSEVSGCSTWLGQCGGVLSLCPSSGKLLLQKGSTCPSS